MSECCIFGEVLFDCFPHGEQVLGGAPFNVAWNLQALGLSPRLVSRVGADVAGNRVRDAMQRWGMDTGGLQVDAERPTGRVMVTFDAGEPRYDIVADSAWDAIEAQPQPPCALLYHGSLALRSTASASALEALRGQHRGTVFVDVNLRPPWWQASAVTAMLDHAHWAKLNREELGLLRPGDVPDPMALLRDCGLRGLVLTLGDEGAELLTDDGNRRQVAPGPEVDVVDTVGAGDAFASVMLLGLLRQWPGELILSRAQQFAAAVVGQRGATCEDPAFYRQFRDAWKLDQEHS
ncbi:MAG: carbohydrate kinase family protein [Anaerolineae bacterium]